MAHLIDCSNDRANMAYAGQKPWHGLGVELNPDSPLEMWAEQAGFNWEVKKSPVQFQILDAEGQPTGDHQTIKNRWALYRSDTNAPLSVMSSNFRITQPKQVVEFFRDLIEQGGAKMHTMGMLSGGAKFWALAKFDDDFKINGDEVLPYLLLATSCDGTLANTAVLTSVRVVCQNTLTVATREEGKARISVPHSTDFNAEHFKTQLGLMGGTWAQFKKDAVELSKRKVSREEAVKFFLTTLYPKTEADKIDLDIARPMLQSILNVYENGVGQSTKAAKGTAFGLVNAITRFTDHERQSASNDSRLNSAWFGSGALMKRRAYDNALQLLAA